MKSIEWLKLVQGYTMHFELYYSKTTDWYLKVWKKGCGKNGKDLIVCKYQDCSLSRVLTRGEAAIKKFLIKNRLYAPELEHGDDMKTKELEK